jgi:hypothetical protein
MRGPETGYCPLPDQEYMRNTTDKMSKILNYSTNCHSLDRFNFIAHKDCGVPVVAPSLNGIFREAVDSQFTVQYWSFA